MSILPITLINVSKQAHNIHWNEQVHDGSGCKASSKINESYTVKYFNNFFLSKKKMDVSVNVTLILHAQIQMNKKTLFHGEKVQGLFLPMLQCKFCKLKFEILKFKFYKGGGGGLDPKIFYCKWSILLSFYSIPPFLILFI